MGYKVSKKVWIIHYLFHKNFYLHLIYNINQAKTLCAKCPHSIKDSKYRNTHIGKYGHPHGSQSERGKQQHGNLHANGKPHVLTGNGQGTTGDAYCLSYLQGLIGHQYHIGSLDGCVTAQSAHGNTHVGSCQYGGVVDAVTDKGLGCLVSS